MLYQHELFLLDMKQMMQFLNRHKATLKKKREEEKIKELEKHLGLCSIAVAEKSTEISNGTEDTSVKEDQASGNDEKMNIPEQHPVLKKSTKETANKLDDGGYRPATPQPFNIRALKMLHKRGNYTVEQFLTYGYRELLTAEDRRDLLRMEVANNRRNNQLKTTNLNRGLATSESQGAFDVTSVGEALPELSYCSEGVPEMKRNSIFQDMDIKTED